MAEKLLANHQETINSSLGSILLLDRQSRMSITNKTYNKMNKDLSFAGKNRNQGENSSKSIGANSKSDFKSPKPGNNLSNSPSARLDLSIDDSLHSSVSRHRGSSLDK
jgi:hypothetical protein